MKLFGFTLLVVMWIASVVASAFVAPLGFSSCSTRVHELAMAVELVPEPQGGEELQATSSGMLDSRVKNMGQAEGAKSDGGATVYRFWLSSVAEGELVKQIRTQILKDASKKANFPGFRKVCFEVCVLDFVRQLHSISISHPHVL